MTLLESDGHRWRKSSRSGTGNNCVEVLRQRSRVAIRDSKDPYGSILMVDAPAWRAFIALQATIE